MAVQSLRKWPDSTCENLTQCRLWEDEGLTDGGTAPGTAAVGAFAAEGAGSAAPA